MTILPPLIHTCASHASFIQRMHTSIFSLFALPPPQSKQSSFNRAWSQFCVSSNSCQRCVRDLQWWEYLTIVTAGQPFHKNNSSSSSSSSSLSPSQMKMIYIFIYVTTCKPQEGISTESLFSVRSIQQGDLVNRNEFKWTCFFFHLTSKIHIEVRTLNSKWLRFKMVLADLTKARKINHWWLLVLKILYHKEVFKFICWIVITIKWPLIKTWAAELWHCSKKELEYKVLKQNIFSFLESNIWTGNVPLITSRWCRLTLPCFIMVRKQKMILMLCCENLIYPWYARGLKCTTLNSGTLTDFEDKNLNFFAVRVKHSNNKYLILSNPKLKWSSVFYLRTYLLCNSTPSSICLRPHLVLLI